MKIICIGRNYIDHAKELKNKVPTEPVFFLKPETALLPKRNPFYIPDFSKDVHHELELVVRICRVGKNIEAKFAHRYYEEVSLGIDFTARDVQNQCKDKGLPWEKAKAFDSSAPVGRFMLLEKGQSIQNLNIELTNNGETVQSVNTSEMIFDVDHIIAYVSQFMTLKIGDLIFTGTPKGVGQVTKGDTLQCFLEGVEMLKVNIR